MAWAQGVAMGEAAMEATGLPMVRVTCVMS